MTGAQMQAAFSVLGKRLSYIAGDMGKVCTLMHGAMLGAPGHRNGNRLLCTRNR